MFKNKRIYNLILCIMMFVVLSTMVCFNVSFADGEDTTKPTGVIEYKRLSDGTVIALVVNLSEEVVFESDSFYIFTETGEYTFVFRDLSGNTTELTAYYDLTPPNAEISYTDNSDGTVLAKVINPTKEVTYKDGISQYLFEENGSYTFVIFDSYGNEKELTAIVDYIDKTPPTGSVKYTTLSNGNVLAEVVDLSEEVEFGVDGGKYTFTRNTTYTFVFYDLRGNKGSVVATVNWIDKKAPTGEIEYFRLSNGYIMAVVTNLSEEVVFEGGKDYHIFDGSERNYTFKFYDKSENLGTVTASVNDIILEEPTSELIYTKLDTGDVLVEVAKKTGIVFGLDEGKHLFTENGSYTFEIYDFYGNKGILEASVNYIDKILPTGEIEYETLDDGNVIARVINLSEEVTFENDISEYLFTNNGEYVFVFYDLAGNKGTLTAMVNTIDNIPPTCEIKYEKFESGSVLAMLINFSEEVTNVTDNGMHIFTENGTFKFEFYDLAGNKGEAIAEVKNIGVPDEDKPGEGEKEKEDDKKSFLEIIKDVFKGDTIYIVIVAVSSVLILVIALVLILRKKNK